MRPIALPLLAALALMLAACGDSDSEVGAVSNDWTGNEVKIQALADPKVDGVTCHMSHFDRSFLDRIGNGNWFENPSNASIACRQTGPLHIHEIDLDRNGEEVFSQRQSLVFKSLAVRRIYDAGSNTLIYLVYSREVSEGSAKMAISTVALYDQDVVWDKVPPVN